VEELEVLLAKIITRTMCILTRLGARIEEPDQTYLAETDTNGALRALQAASCTYRIAVGPRAGQKVLSLQSLPSRARPSDPDLWVNAHGFSLHEAVRWRADQRKDLEHLCPYITRPAIANERLKRSRAGHLVLQLKRRVQGRHHPYRHEAAGVHAVRVAALVPRPRFASDPVRQAASMACWCPTRSCEVKSFPLRHSVPPSPRPITPKVRERHRGSLKIIALY
jgi:Putative transposase